MDETTLQGVWQWLDGKPGVTGNEPFFQELGDAADWMGYPCFLRIGQGSGKHEWERCCYLKCRTDIPKHVGALAEWSQTVDFMGLPFDVWAVRDMLPTTPLCLLPSYGNFPLVPEVRAFVRDGEVSCVHPYWPREAIAQGFPYTPFTDLDADEPENQLPEDFEAIVERCEQAATMSEPCNLAQRVAIVFKDDGAWSVDILPTERGWYITDMAEANRSFHWEGCKYGGKAESR